MNDLRLPWHRETVGHASIGQIAAKVSLDLAHPLPDGIPPSTDATWIINADNKVVAFVGNGPRQVENADAIIAAVEAVTQLRADGWDVERKFYTYEFAAKNELPWFEPDEEGQP